MRATDRPSPTVPRIAAAAVLGVRIHQLTMAQAVASVRQLIAIGGGYEVVTVNAPMLIRAARDPRVRELLNGATLATADGAGVLLAGKILGHQFPERVPGIDLVEHLCAVAAADGLRVYLLGAEPGVAQTAASALGTRYPGLTIVGVRHGYVPPSEEAEVIAHIRTTRPHLLLVGLGSPRQEGWIASHLEEVSPIVCVGVGGTFDVLAGRRRRAPLWMRQAGLEWVYRWMQEPKRWRVMVTLPQIIWLALKARVASWWTGAVSP